MNRIQSQAEIEFRERFYRCELVGNPEPREVKLWQKLIRNEETKREADLIEEILAHLGEEETPEKNTRALNMVLEARNNGYIEDTGRPWKHEYRINKSIIKESKMLNINEFIKNQGKSLVAEKKTKQKDSVVIEPWDKPNQKYKIRHSSADFYCNDTGERTTELRGRLKGIYYNERPAEGANFNITEFWIVLIDETNKQKVIAYGEDGAIAVQDLINRCCNIKDQEELDIEISLYEHEAWNGRSYINGMVRRLGDTKEIEPMKSYYDLPDGMAGKIEFYKEEIEKLNARIRDWN